MSEWPEERKHEPRHKGADGREVGEQEVGLPLAEGSYWRMEREEARRVA